MKATDENYRGYEDDYRNLNHLDIDAGAFDKLGILGVIEKKISKKQTR
ncbi:MAG: hypothetical protein ACP5K2_06485 [bacterium]